MGIRSTTKMMKPVAFIALMLGVALAAPTSSSPEILLTQKAAADARKTITDMLAAGKDSSACSDLADAILDEVRNAGKEEEKVLATLDDGADCTNQFAGAVTAAEDAVTAAESAKTEADSAVTSAASAPVEFSPVDLSTLDTAEGFSCSALASDPAYTSAVAALESAKTAATNAEASLNAAKTTLEATRRQAADAVKICQCHAYATYKEAYDKASSDFSSDHTEAWTKGKHMQCVLAGTAPDACEVGSPPALEMRTLAPGVDGANCEGGHSNWVNTPGCYVRTPSGCPHQSFDSMDASHFDISKGWAHDSWGEEHRDAKNSESKCMEERKKDYDAWCAATDTEMRWVPPEGGYVGRETAAASGGVEGAVVAPDRELPDGGEFGPAAPSSKLCVYTDPANVDFASGERSEGPAILADLRHYLTDGDARLTEMPNIAEMDAKCAPGGTMVIPECERTAISSATAEHMKRYVEDGGTVIFTDDSVGNVATAVNTIAGLSWTSGSNSVATKKTTSARFADTPETLPSLNGGAAVRASSFGAGSNVLYESSSGDVLVGQVRVGAGQIWWLGFDWFQGNHSPGGGGGGAGVRDGWAQVLAAAVGK